MIITIFGIFKKDIELSRKNNTILFDLYVSMTNLVAIGVDTLRIDSDYSLEKVIIELIHMNPKMILYLVFNHINSCQGCVWKYRKSSQ